MGKPHRCPVCDATGKVKKKKCIACKGACVLWEPMDEAISFPIVPAPYPYPLPYWEQPYWEQPLWRQTYYNTAGNTSEVSIVPTTTVEPRNLMDAYCTTSGSWN